MKVLFANEKVQQQCTSMKAASKLLGGNKFACEDPCVAAGFYVKGYYCYANIPFS